MQLQNLSPEEVASKFVGVRFLGHDKKGRERFECSKQKNGVRPTRVVTDRNEIKTMLIKLEAIADMKIKNSSTDIDADVSTIKRSRSNVISVSKSGKKIWSLDEAMSALTKHYESEAGISDAGMKTKLSLIKTIKKELKQLDDYEIHGDTLVSDLADDDLIESYKDYLRDVAGVQNKTADKRLSILNMMFYVAKKRKHLDIKFSCERYNVDSGNIHYLTDQEEKQVLDTFKLLGKGDHWEVAQVLLDKGCRQDDLWRITERCIDWDRKYPTVFIKASKNGKDRTLKISERCLPIFKRRMTGNPSMRLFPFNNDWMRNGWKTMKEKLGRTEGWFTPHILRHTCGSRLAQENMSAKYIQDYLGHKSIQATFRYMHLATDNLDACVDVLNKRNGSVTVKTDNGALQNLQLTQQQLSEVAKLISSFNTNQNKDTKDIVSDTETVNL